MFLSVINININCLQVVITTDYGMSYALTGNEDNHMKLRTDIAKYYRNHWFSSLNVRHKKIDVDGE